MSFQHPEARAAGLAAAETDCLQPTRSHHASARVLLDVDETMPLPADRIGGWCCRRFGGCKRYPMQPAGTRREPLCALFPRIWLQRVGPFPPSISANVRHLQIANSCSAGCDHEIGRGFCSRGLMRKVDDVRGAFRFVADLPIGAPAGDARRKWSNEPLGRDSSQRGARRRGKAGQSTGSELVSCSRGTATI